MLSTTTLRIQDLPLWDKMLAKRAPLAFDLEITARCMNHCRHCYIDVPAGDPEARRQEITLAETHRFADDAVALGAFWCLITGGEPLLREDFSGIYLALKRKGLLVSVFTTAQTITADHVELFRRYPPRDLEITVYGVTRATYERVTRRPGSFNAFILGLDRLLGAGVKVRLKAMALRSNVAELPAIELFCRERTKDYFRFDPVLHLRFDGDARRNQEILAERLSPTEIAALDQVDGNRVEQLRKECARMESADAPHADMDRIFRCGAGVGSFCISHDARFRLCSALCHPDYTYDLRKGSLAEAWERFVPALRELKSGRPEYQETCGACTIAGLCSYCPAHALLESGALDGEAQYFCDVAHARMQVLRR